MQISAAEVRVYRALVPTVWKTAAQVAAEAGVAGRTSRLHLAHLADLGLAERATLFAGYRYRQVERPDLRAAEHLTALLRAGEIFDSEIPTATEAPAN